MEQRPPNLNLKRTLIPHVQHAMARLLQGLRYQAVQVLMISSMVIPPASLPRISSTGTRVPLMKGERGVLRL